MASKLNMQSFIGPSDPSLPRSEIDGYQPVSRIGEVVINAFIDGQEYMRLDTLQNQESRTGGAYEVINTNGDSVPHYHEWAAVLPGMVMLMRKRRHESWTNRVAAETAVPVISCVACLGNDEEAEIKNWQFAGIARSKNVPPVDDGSGPSYDEYFTLALGGMAVVLNSSDKHIFPGNYVEWCFIARANGSTDTKKGPRRVGIKAYNTPGPRTIGRAMSQAAPAEPLDILIYQS
jgi:hypothetical protein